VLLLHLSAYLIDIALGTTTTNCLNTTNLCLPLGYRGISPLLINHIVWAIHGLLPSIPCIVFMNILPILFSSY